MPRSRSIIEAPSAQVNRAWRASRTAVVVFAVLSLATACTSDEKRAEAMYREAVALADASGLEQAIERFDEIARAYPDTEAGERARREAVLYRGLEGAVDRYPVHRLRDLMIETARRVERHRARRGRPPATLAEAMPDGAVPVDPWGRPLVYGTSRGGRSYEIASYGADGEPGGEGPDADLVVRDGEFTGSSR